MIGVLYIGMVLVCFLASLVIIFSALLKHNVGLFQSRIGENPRRDYHNT